MIYVIRQLFLCGFCGLCKGPLSHCLYEMAPGRRSFTDALFGGQKCRKPVEIVSLFITMPAVPSKMTTGGGSGLIRGGQSPRLIKKNVIRSN